MASVLIKLIMDMWIAGNPQETFALVFSMLEAALRQPDAQYRIRVFDMLYNLSLHGQMIESATPMADSARSSSSTDAGALTARLAPRLLMFAPQNAPGSSSWQVFLPEQAVRLSCIIVSCAPGAPAPTWITYRGCDGVVKGLRCFVRNAFIPEPLAMAPAPAAKE